jgi:tetratricopeptide (TPR) repeat protein
VLTLIVSVALAASSPDLPWERGPFAGSSADVARAAAGLKPPRDVPLEILLREEKLGLDGQGGSVNASRLVVRPLSAEGVRSASVVFANWQPWLQERPEIRARVVSPSGEEYVLDAATLSEAPFEPAPGIMTDQRVVRGPLPGVDQGSIVEILITTRAHDAFPGIGSLWVAPVPDLPVGHLRVRVEAPATVPLRHALHGLPETKRESREGERRVREWEWKALAAEAPPEPDEPGPMADRRHLALSTAASWRSVAERYAAVVEARLAGADVGAQAREIAGAARSRDEAAVHILGFIRERVRYTGLELGMSAMVPASPGDVLARRYGDCKDLSLLFVSLMRALGHEAHVALVRAGTADVDPALPALAAFNHAVVWLGGAAPRFVDATLPDLPVGLLPAGVDGKLALVVRAGTEDLVRIPRAASGDYRVDIEREVRLEKSGPVRVTETRRFQGVLAAEMRLRVRQRPLEQVEKAYQAISRERLRADEVAVKLDAPEGAPAVLRSDAPRSKLGDVREEDAKVRLDPHVLACLPGALQPVEASKDDKDRAPGERKRPLEVVRPCDGELRYRVTAPPGFEIVEPLPPPSTVRAGPLRLESQYGVEPGGVVLARYTISLPQGEIAASDVNSIRGALSRLERDGPQVKFQRTSARLLEGGHGREALAELHRLAEAAPSDSDALVRLALAYRKLGLGAAARAAAARAVALAPGSGWAQRVLGMVLSEDPVSRPGQAGWDMAGAVAAARRAAELEPRAPRTLAFLASLLVRGEDGVLLGRGARPEEAVKAYRKARDQLGDRAHDADLVRALLYTRRFAEATALARELPPGADRNALLPAASMMSEGAEGAGGEVAKLYPQDRAAAIVGAAGALAILREYARAVELIERAGSLSEGEARVEALGRNLRAASRLAEAVPAGSPQAAVRRFIEAALGTGSLADAVAPERTIPPRDPQLFAARLRGPAGSLAHIAGPDFVVGTAKIRLDETIGDVAQVSLAYGLQPFRLYVLRSRGAWRVLAVQGEDGELGREALRRLERGEVEPARRLLAWARLGVRSDALRDGDAHSARRSIAVDPAAAAPDELRLLAAALAATSGEPAAAAPILERALSQGARDANRRPLLAALGLAYVQQERWTDLLKLAEGARSEKPSAWAAALRVHALGGLGRTEELRRSVREDTADAPSPARLLAVGHAALSAGAIDEGIAVLARAVESEEAAAHDLNQIAWASLFVDPMPALAVREARRASELRHDRDPATLHTLAALLARTGEPAEAMKTLWSAIESAGGSMRSQDWVVVGLVAEAYGEREEAIAAYRRVERPARPSPVSAWALARRALARMQGEAKPSAAR